MILPQLRETTRVDHLQLETRIDLLNRAWSPEFYRALLEKFHGFYAPLEPAIFNQQQWQNFNFSTASRCKTDWLHNDLRFCGLSEAQIAALPRCKYMERPESFAQALGCAYVVEGSTLGGQIIARHLRKQLNLPPEGLRFFTAYGAETGAKWREFVALLNDYQATERERNEILAAASATFRALECWLDEII